MAATLKEEEEDRGDCGKLSSSQGGQNTAVIVCLWISNFKKLVVNIETSPGCHQRSLNILLK
jgi:hypothetical protein